MATDFQSAARFEHRFWLRVLGEHAQFLHDTLAPNEKEDIKKANEFIQIFEQLLSQVNTADLVQLSRKADEEAQKIRAFKLTIIERQLVGGITINLTPSFINHMVNEVEEYLRVLEYLKKSEVPPIFHELHHHLVWLLDAAGHAGAISGNLDRIEKRVKEKSDLYTKHFEEFYLKAVEMASFLKTNLSSFPALDRMNTDVSLEMKLFMGFLEELEEMGLSKEALGSFSALMADHMYREECYYLIKVAEATNQPAPDCDPGKPFVQGK
ncbi:DUF2935 domain-containing protein [Lederbergia sp. NSJ-179]|uniref:DUF2935 domain-containing protein n=1 Tax=Lederbergia sp. NSJ-179 TaxID=2931402 RepID=UPI001FD0DD5A|nr:DUF2935 domain-containing protein [Lederbergia sp. NSJ-179]MCJ7842040.1 DUF2935 domain-containing protein [Lederbergia sp. NSJ-179]